MQLTAGVAAVGVREYNIFIGNNDKYEHKGE
jgi:hypothetical protein